MKSIDNFTNEVLEKARRGKRKKGIIASAVSIGVTGLVIFAVAFSNIIDFGSVTLYPNAYKKFMKSYATEEGRYAGLRIVDKESAVFALDDKAYYCTLKSESKNSFELVSYSDAGEEDSSATRNNLSVEFSGDEANVEGEVGNEYIDVTLTIVEDMQLDYGFWGMFGRDDTITGEFQYLNGQNWMMFLKNGESYVGEGSAVWSSEYYSVGDKILQYIRDQGSGVAEVSLFEVIPAEVFGYTAIKNTLEGGDDSFVSYYRLWEEDELYDFVGGQFNAQFVQSESYNEQISEKELLGYTDINWRLIPKSGREKSVLDCKMSLDLREDKTLTFKAFGASEYRAEIEGKWYPLKDKILVILDKKYDLIGRAFSIHEGNDWSEAGLTETAITHIDREDLYKVGYHWFEYYHHSTFTTIYWGSGWSEGFVYPELTYERKYVFNGWSTDWYIRGQPTEQLPFPYNGESFLIFHENGYFDYYTNDLLLHTYRYTVEKDDGTYVSFQEKILIETDENEFESVDGMNLTSGSLYMDYVAYMVDSVSNNWKKDTKIAFALTNDNELPEQPDLSGQTGEFFYRQYGWSGRDIILLGYSGAIEGTTFIIPASIDGYKVDSFDASLFESLSDAGITEVKIPATLQGSFGATHFSALKQLTSITVYGNRGKYISADGVLYGNDGTLICYPLGKKAEAFIVPESVAGIPICSIDVYAFKGNAYLKSVDLGTHVRDIRLEAFFNCTALENCLGSENVTLVGQAAFAGTPFQNKHASGFFVIGKVLYRYVGETEIITADMFPPGVEYIAIDSFLDSTVREIYLPSTVAFIDLVAFYGCPQLKSIYITGEQLPNIQKQTFEGLSDFRIYCSQNLIDGITEDSVWYAYIDRMLPWEPTEA